MSVVLGVMGDVNFPRDEEGRTFHIQAKRGEVANRILTVGSHDRGELIAKHLEHVHTVKSRRGFVVYTGLYKNIPVSVVVSCMGSANMDFVVREIRAVVTGDMVIFRMGSCGALKSKVGVNSLIFSNAACFVETNYDAFHCVNDKQDHYRISSPVEADSDLTAHVLILCMI
jgi:uridine phosphorylase